MLTNNFESSYRHMAHAYFFYILLQDSSVVVSTKLWRRRHLKRLMMFLTEHYNMFVPNL